MARRAPFGAVPIIPPAGGAVRVDQTEAPGQLTVHWIDINRGEWGEQQAISGGRVVAITAPGPGNWAAAIVRQP